MYVRLCNLDILREKWLDFANSGDPDQMPRSALFANYSFRGFPDYNGIMTILHDAINIIINSSLFKNMLDFFNNSVTYQFKLKHLSRQEGYD